MVGIDLNGKNAVVTGVADDGGFAWAIAKSLQAAGAGVYLASHPRVTGIVERILTRNQNAEARKLPYGAAGEFAPAAVIACDVEYDRYDEIPEEKLATKAYKDRDASIAGCLARYDELSGGAPIDILIHSVAFSPEIQNSHLETSRAAYLTAQSVSAYSLVALTRASMSRFASSASVVGLTYLAAERVVPGYGGGMASAKAALECDARALAWFAGEKGVRVNVISAGPYPSRAARSIGDIQKMVDEAAKLSPLRRGISAEDVANSTLFLCSPLGSAISGEVLHVDCGFHAMSPLAIAG